MQAAALTLPKLWPSSCMKELQGLLNINGITDGQNRRQGGPKGGNLLSATRPLLSRHQCQPGPSTNGEPHLMSHTTLLGLLVCSAHRWSGSTANR